MGLVQTVRIRSNRRRCARAAGVESSCRRSDRISGDVTGYPVRHIGDAISGPSDVLLGRRTEDFEQDLAALHVSGQRFGDGAGRHSEWSASAGRPARANHVRLAVSEIANRKVAAAITATVRVGMAAGVCTPKRSRDGCPCRAAGRDADWNADHECGGGDGCRLPNDARYDLSFAEPEAAEQREVASSSAHCCEEEVGDRGGRDSGEQRGRRARGSHPLAAGFRPRPSVGSRESPRVPGLHWPGQRGRFRVRSGRHRTPARCLVRPARPIS